MRAMLTASALAMIAGLVATGPMSAQQAADPLQDQSLPGSQARSGRRAAPTQRATRAGRGGQRRRHARGDRRRCCRDGQAAHRARLCRAAAGQWPTPTCRASGRTPPTPTLTRPAQFKSLVMNDQEAAAARRAHPQNIRQATDDNQKEADGLLNGKDLAAGRGLQLFLDRSRHKLLADQGDVADLVDRRSAERADPLLRRRPQAVGCAARRSRQWLRHPEERSLPERCIFFGRSAGPPLTNGLYNNNYRITQSADAVAIEAEMIHETRIIRLGAKHDPAALNRYAGDSVRLV